MSDSRIVRAAAVQILPDFDSTDGTLNKVCDFITQAAARGAQLVVFPETFVPYYPYFSFIRPPMLSGAEHLRLMERVSLRALRRAFALRGPSSSELSWPLSFQSLSPVTARSTPLNASSRMTALWKSTSS